MNSNSQTMIDFANTEVAFKMKTKNDLRQSKLLFATLSSPQVVQTLKGLTLASLRLRLPIKGGNTVPLLGNGFDIRRIGVALGVTDRDHFHVA